MCSACRAPSDEAALQANTLLHFNAGSASPTSGRLCWAWDFRAFGWMLPSTCSQTVCVVAPTSPFLLGRLAFSCVTCTVDLAAMFNLFRINLGGELPADFVTWLEVLTGKWTGSIEQERRL